MEVYYCGGITFHETIIGGRGPYALPQAIDIEVYDQRALRNPGRDETRDGTGCPGEAVPY